MTPTKSILQKWAELHDLGRNFYWRFWPETFCILARLRRVLRTIFEAEYENRPQNALRLFLNRRFTPTCHCVQNDWIQSRTLAKVILQQICFWIHVSALFLSLNTKIDSKMLFELASTAFQSTFYYQWPLYAKCHFQIALFKCISLTEWSHIWAGFFFLNALRD